MSAARDASEFEVEPIPGLPSALPPGEQLLWQGRPRWQGLAVHTFRLGWLALYFAGLTVLGGVRVLPLAVAAMGLFTLMAWLNARATVYSITSRRVVMRFGVALPMTFNLPFKRLASADLKMWKNGDGDIALELAPPDRIAWLHLWPHARPWRFARAQPMLRDIPDAARVSALLTEAVQAAA